MKRAKENGNDILLYDSIQETPITRFMEYNRYLFIDSKVGADHNALEQHIALLHKYSENGDKERHKKQLMNYHLAIQFIMGRINPRMNAFVAMMKELNGKQVVDVDENAAAEYIQEMGRRGLTWGKMNFHLAALKKKLQLSWTRFFRRLLIPRKSKNISPS